MRKVNQTILFYNNLNNHKKKLGRVSINKKNKKIWICNNKNLKKKI